MGAYEANVFSAVFIRADTKQIFQGIQKILVYKTDWNHNRACADSRAVLYLQRIVRKISRLAELTDLAYQFQKQFINLHMGTS